MNYYCINNRRTQWLLKTQSYSTINSPHLAAFCSCSQAFLMGELNWNLRHLSLGHLPLALEISRFNATPGEDSVCVSGWKLKWSSLLFYCAACEGLKDVLFKRNVNLQLNSAYYLWGKCCCLLFFIWVCVLLYF